MRKKILTTVIIIILLSATIITTLFVMFNDLNKYTQVRDELKNYCQYIINLNINDSEEAYNFKINNVKVRVTHINEDGDVLFDSENTDLENHKNREEVKLALKEGEGYGTRVSDTVGEKLVYYARVMDDGTILRVSIPYKTVSFFNSQNIFFGIIVILIVLIFSVALSDRIIRTFINPLKELESVTNRIAHGDLNIRAKSGTADEIGSLAMTFNNMADQLQSKINEVIDKQNRLESILSSMQSGVIAVSMDDKIITINPYAKAVLGIKNYKVGDKISQYVKDYDIITIFNEDDSLEKEIKVLNPVERELKIKKAFLLNGTKRIGKVIAIHDITEIKKLENIRSQFVANVSHELKTPLTSIKGFSETLRFVNDNKTKDKFLDIIDKEADRLTRLINDILVLSRLESSYYSEKEEFDPSLVIGEVVSIIKTIANEKNIVITLNNDFEGMLLGNRDKFYQLVLNLIENAVKYSNSGDTVIVRSYSNMDKYVFEVQDTGIGIPKDDIPRIFERFYRVDKSRKGSSTGLGLAIVKHIVKMYNGEIDVESELNKGSKFIVKFNLTD